MFKCEIPAVSMRAEGKLQAAEGGEGSWHVGKAGKCKASFSVNSEQTRREGWI